MIRCPICNSSDYHVNPGYGASCEDCGYTRDAEGGESGGSKDE